VGRGVDEGTHPPITKIKDKPKDKNTCRNACFIRITPSEVKAEDFIDVNLNEEQPPGRIIDWQATKRQ
jgi:hypothetical protein